MLTKLLYQNKRNKEEGFTLVELLVVILIIGVLTAIALPIFLNQQRAAMRASLISDAKNSMTQVQTWLAVKKPAFTQTAGTKVYLSKSGIDGNTVDPGMTSYRVPTNEVSLVSSRADTSTQATIGYIGANRGTMYYVEIMTFNLNAAPEEGSVKIISDTTGTRTILGSDFR